MPLEIISSAVLSGNLPVETIEKLMNLQDRWEVKKAKKEYDEAMAKFQCDCPIIKKTKPVKDRTKTIIYNYAPLDSIVAQTKHLIAKHGLSYSIQTEIVGVNGETKIMATVKVSHTAGHTETSTFGVPVEHRLSSEGKSLMSAPQEFGSALTFAKRYAFCNAFGILTGDEDNDATTAAKKETPVVQVEDATEYQLTLESAGTLAELQDAWVKVPDFIKIKLKKVKDDLKKKLNENS